MPRLLRVLAPVLLAALAIVAAAALPTSASAAATGPTPLSGVKWDTKVIRLYDTTPAAYREGIDMAIRSWNARRIGVTFARTTVRSRAHVVVGTAFYAGSVQGRATVGKVRGAWIRLDTGLVATEPTMRGNTITNVAGGAIPETIAETMAHEMGHVLGLMHTTGCTLMGGPAHVDTCPVTPTPGTWSCRLQQRRDVLAAARRYGGPGVVQAATRCPLSPTRAGTVGAVTRIATSDPRIAFTLDWRATTNTYGYVVGRSAPGGACPATPSAAAAQRDLDDSEVTERWDSGDLPSVSATYCISIWSRNGRGTLTGPTRATVAVKGNAADPVTDVSATLAGTDVQVAWSQPAGTTILNVYRYGTDGTCARPAGQSSIATFGSGGPSTYTDTFVPSGAWTYAITRSDATEEQGFDGSRPDSVAVCASVTVP